MLMLLVSLLLIWIIFLRKVRIAQYVYFIECVPTFQKFCVIHVTNHIHCLSDSVQLGFLPREVAKWVAPLSDAGFFNFSGFIYPREALEAAFGVTNIKVQLLLYVSKVH